MQERARYRPATIADLERHGPALEALYDRSARALHASHYSTAQIAGMVPELVRINRQRIPAGHHMLALVEDDVAGIACWVPGDFHGASARIGTLYVLPEYSGRGIGSDLVRRTLDDAAAAGHPRLGVNASLNAVDFYARFGFVPVGELQIPLADGLTFPCIEMVQPAP